MSTVNKAVDGKSEFYPTVLSQSFADAMPVCSTSSNFWDAFVLQQQQQQLGQNYHTFNKPIGNISQDIHHEYNPDAALLAVSAPQRLGIHDLVIAPNLSLFMPCHQKSVIKDDVFLAQPSSHHVDIDDNASLSSHSTLSSFQPSVASPYCLSPVSSPTHFLYNHEPLFEGGIIETEDRPLLGYDGEDEDHGDFLSAMTGPTLKQQEQSLPTGGDLVWLKLLNAFHADVTSDILASSETAIEDDKDSLGLSNLFSESDLDDYVFTNNIVPGSTNNKRKRVTKAKSSSTTTKTAAAAKKPSQKRQRKNKPTAKRQLKMKVHEEVLVTVSTDAEFIQKPTSSSDNKEEYDVMDQNKETSSHRQLTGSAVSDDNSTVFQQLTDASVDWCRYCGTTEGVNWRPGPWGKRTLCNKHGCDYKGYGLASRLPRLDLSAYMDENIEDRIRPIVQEFCLVCQCPDQVENNQLVHCQGGCSRAYHRQCHKPLTKADPSAPWYCGELCKENRQLKKVGMYKYLG
ncbi:hypothetical protein MAM1_0001d00020 [Mucor ambiguus]|uniref:PHD-type domain-containing protein n=1 Tax=Mucor ambiguus TaxID=91626 RepID=A0A0C9MF24_9FUNG|nr:hypothetical protein MAM1_0001d00020 [Mucor ambiguus]